MSAIFELGYELSDSLEKELFLIEKAADIELRRIFDQMDICVLMESSGKEEPGGLIGLIRKGFKVISDMLASIGEKIKTLFVGKVNDDQTVRFEKDPRKTAEAADQIINEDISLLNKVMAGKITVNDVKQKVDQHANMLDAVGPYVGAAAGLIGGVLADRAITSKWKKEIDQAYHQNAGKMSEYAEQLAKSRTYDSKKDTVNEAVQYLMKDIYNASNKGSSAIANFGKKCYAKQIIKDRLKEEADHMSSRSGGIIYRLNERRKQSVLNREADRLERRKSAIERNREKNTKEKERTAEAMQRRSDAYSDLYLDAPKQRYVKNTPGGKLNELNHKAQTLDTPSKQKKKPSMGQRVRELNKLAHVGVDNSERTDVAHLKKS